MTSPTPDEIRERLIQWRAIRRACAIDSADPVESHKAVLADALLADFADRLTGLDVGPTFRPVDRRRDTRSFK